jgi:hypothetical protein
LESGHELDRFQIRIVYPRAFPDRGAHPSVELESHHDQWELTDDCHMPKWFMCLFVAAESGLDFSRPDELELLLGHVHTFLFRQRVYQKDLRRHRAMGTPAPVWPGPERAHGFQGLADVILAAGGRLGRNAPCVCGSGLKYKKCHLPDVQPLLDATPLTTMPKKKGTP